MKNFNYFNQKLEKLQQQKKDLPSLKDLSLTQFIKYKRIQSKEKKLCFIMENKLALGNEVNFWYNVQNKSWIENPNITPMKYYKLEKNAKYKKDLKLYKLGLIEEKPTPPIIQKLNDFISPVKDYFKENFPIIKKTFSKYNYIKKIQKKYNYFKSNTLPKKFNNLAVTTASVGIKGYRHLKFNCRYIRNSLVSKDTFQFLKNVVNEANHRLDISESSKEIPHKEEKSTFRESIKLENFKSDYTNFKDYCHESISVNPSYSSKLLKHNSPIYKNPHYEKNNYEISR